MSRPQNRFDHSAAVAFSAALALVMLGACSTESKPAEPSEREPSVPRWTPESAMAALTLPHQKISRAIGPHQIDCTAELAVSSAGRASRRVAQTVRILADDHGQYSASKNTHRQYGQHATYHDGWLYLRPRYGTYLRRRPIDAAEPQRIADRIYGLLPAYVELLGRFSQIRLAKQRDGRIEVALALHDKPRAEPSTPRAAARRWRQAIEVIALAGSAELDGKSGTPMKVDLTAKWRAKSPDDVVSFSGIPQGLHTSATSTMTLRFHQQIRRVTPPRAIEAPKSNSVAATPRRLRLEWERQLITGEREMTDEVDRK